MELVSAVWNCILASMYLFSPCILGSLLPLFCIFAVISVWTIVPIFIKRHQIMTKHKLVLNSSCLLSTCSAVQRSQPSQSTGVVQVERSTTQLPLFRFCNCKL